ncbi:Aste57867_8867 [Aphanomyces stellatus]|uniref:Aste57867_8867 protein n=1 Tax=Aphanomyces stellatus TaxID=120398 RepID=A0A485KLF0_9STRA|nr:hypothetical protein As57867_008832 [Aphanomyces stellatus]VFT85753.1 Aste57867_8867 [Aphanomyces stellatus]
MKKQKLAHASAWPLWPRELTQLICAFQDGIYQDMIPLGRIQHIGNPCNEHKAITILQNAITLVEPWLASFGLSRIPLLLACLPHMGAILACYSVYANDIQVRAFLMAHNQDLLLNNIVLRVAIKMGALETLQFLHAAGFDHGGFSIPFLMGLSAESGRVDVVRYCRDTLLIDVPVAVAQDADWMVLMCAARFNYVEIAQLVVAHPRCTLDIIAPALGVASDLHHLQVVTCLLDRTNGDMTTCMQETLNRVCDHDQVDVARCFFFNLDGTTRYAPSTQNRYFRRAVWFGCVGIATFLGKEMHSGSIHATDVYIAAIRDHVGVLEILRRQQEPVVKDMGLFNGMLLFMTGCFKKIPTLAHVAEAVNVDVMVLVLHVVQPTTDDVGAVLSKIGLMPEMRQLLESFQATANDKVQNTGTMSLD